MAKNVMKLLKPSPHRQRNDFDLSHRHVFDANFGEILPATCIETVPGDNITLHASDLIRNIPFVSSPFLRAKQHLDVWFVPYQDLWHNFNQFITQKDQPVSSALKGSAYCPHFTQYQLYYSVNYASVNSNYKDIVGRALADRSYYLLQLLGYGDIENKHGYEDNTLAVNPFRLAAYNYIWYNEYRQNYYDDGSRLLPSGSNVADLFNFDNLQCDSEANASVYGVNSWQKIAAMCQMRYRTWKKDLFTGILPSTQFGAVSTLSGGSVSGLTAAFVGSQGTVNVNGTTGNDKSSHKLIDWTTNQQYENATWGQQSSIDANGNPLFFGVDQGHNIPDGNAGNLVYGNDTLTSQSAFIPLKTPDDHYVVDVHNHTFSGSGSFTPQGTVNLTTSSGTLSFDVLSLRKAEAIQIWRENALRAGNRVKDNMMAHYGVESDFRDHRPVYLGSVDSPLNISDVMATANSEGVNDVLGDIAGKGLSSLSEKVFKFHAKDFGVIMVMFSMLPEAEYDATGIDRCNQLIESEDFFIPEYENLGLEAVNVSSIVATRTGAATENTVPGYAPRYYGYKTKLDKVFGNFVGNGIFRTWVSQRSDVSDFYGQADPPLTPLRLMYVDPSLFDANFNVGIANSPQFLCDMYFDVDAVRPMSVIGLPFS